jgi:ribonuclease-3
MTGGRERASVTSDAMEALIGAIYLDGGFSVAQNFIQSFVLNDIEKKQLFYDSKTNLQQIAQREYPDRELAYRVVGETGPAHNKTFEVEVYIGERLLGHGKGRSKKSAEQEAAYQALLSLEKEK